MCSRCSWVVEFDITGFYDNINHELLMKMLERRINDRSFLGLIRKWLRAGVLDTDGMILHPATGTPQGGIISCVLANIYLHNALDEWFEKTFKSGSQGDAMMVRYADDWIAGFQFHGELFKIDIKLGALFKDNIKNINAAQYGSDEAFCIEAPNRFFVALRKAQIVATFDFEELSFKESQVDKIIAAKFQNIVNRYESKIH